MRIGIVGSDNSHALAYATLANIDQVCGDSRVVAICGDDPVQTEQVATKGEIPGVVAGPEQLIGNIDAAIVVNRHGGLHANNAIPLLDAGIPVYVDKPFAISVADCNRMIEAAKKASTWVTSFSSLRYASETEELAAMLPELGDIRGAQFSGPCDWESEYAGPFFYATHVADITTRLMGHDIQSVSAQRVGSSVAVNAAFASGALANILYMNDASYHFTASLYGTDAYAHKEIVAGMGAYKAALDVFLDSVERGVEPIGSGKLVVPIRFVEAINESLDAGGTVVSL